MTAPGPQQPDEVLVVELGGKLYGPFGSDQDADQWASHRIGGGSGSWTVRPIHPTPSPSLSQQRRHTEQDGECTHPIWVDAPLRCADCGSPWTPALQAEAERIVAHTPAQPARDTGDGQR